MLIPKTHELAVFEHVAQSYDGFPKMIKIFEKIIITLCYVLQIG